MEGKVNFLDRGINRSELSTQNHLLNSSARHRVHTLALTKVRFIDMLENVSA